MQPIIFDLNLSDETISLFFCFEGLAYQNPTVSTQQILNIWNGTQQLFETGLKELEEKYIIKKVGTNGHNNSFYEVVETNKWLIYN